METLTEGKAEETVQLGLDFNENRGTLHAEAQDLYEANKSTEIIWKKTDS